MLDLVVKNISKTYTFQLGQQFIAPPPWGHMEVSPGPMLPAGTMGSAEARMVITGRSIINAADMFFVWYAQLPPGGPEGGIYWFAVRLCQPVNVGPAGYDPYWQMCAWLASEASAIPHLTDSEPDAGTELLPLPAPVRAVRLQRRRRPAALEPRDQGYAPSRQQRHKRDRSDQRRLGHQLIKGIPFGR